MRNKECKLKGFTAVIYDCKTSQGKCMVTRKLQIDVNKPFFIQTYPGGGA